MNEIVSRSFYGAGMDKTESLVIECGQCVVRSVSACQDCVVTVLLGAPRYKQELDSDEVSAIQALSDAGMVPPLRLVLAADSPQEGDADLTPCDDFFDAV